MVDLGYGATVLGAAILRVSNSALVGFVIICMLLAVLMIYAALAVQKHEVAFQVRMTDGAREQLHDMQLRFIAQAVRVHV